MTIVLAIVLLRNSERDPLLLYLHYLNLFEEEQSFFYGIQCLFIFYRIKFSSELVNSSFRFSQISNSCAVLYSALGDSVVKHIAPVTFGSSVYNQKY